MEFLFRRMVERGVIANRADASWVRKAVSQGRNDLNGEVTSIAIGGALTDNHQRWPYDLLGKFTDDGNNRAGSRIVMTTGLAAGSDWEVASAIGQLIMVEDGAGNPIDLALAGVAPGDAWSIRIDQYERAVAFFARTYIPVRLGWPDESQQLPCYTITLQGSSEQGRPIGNSAHSNSGKALEGPIINTIVSTWNESMNITCWALSPDQAVWMYRAVEYVYRQSARYLGRVFHERVLAQGSEMTERMQLGPRAAYIRNLTIGGVIEKHAEEIVPWVKDSNVPPAIQASIDRVIKSRGG